MFSIGDSLVVFRRKIKGFVMLDYIETVLFFKLLIISPLLFFKLQKSKFTVRKNLKVHTLKFKSAQFLSHYFQHLRYK